MEISRRALAGAAFVLVFVTSSALATVPGRVAYQGLLLDDQGAPVNGVVDLVFTLFDAASGGTQLWNEAHDDVPVADGVYDVQLGASTPITPAIVSGGALHLEIAADGVTLTPRQPLVAVPYALEAASGGSVGGVDAAFVTEAFQHFDFDGGAPPNDDPSEGLGDTDGDGTVNFLDADNDDDGIPDAVEVAAGSDVNLVSPTVTGFSPEPTEASTTTPVTVLGTNFEAGLTVAFGSESPVASNVTPTSLDVMVGPQPAGTVSVQVTLPNGEPGANDFTFVEHTPTITSFSPIVADSAATTVVTVNGTNFFPGLQVTFGSETPTPANVTPTSFDVSVGPQPAGLVNVVVSYPSGNQDSTSYEFLLFDQRRVFVTSLTYDGDLGGLSGADAKCQSLATAASLPGTYLAWLSDGATDPDTRFDQSGGPFAMVNGEILAFDWADLTDGNLLTEFDRDEQGNQVAPNSVWTNVVGDGTHASTNPALSCTGWTTNVAGPAGNAGSTAFTFEAWTSFIGLSCPTSLPLYCFEQ